MPDTGYQIPASGIWHLASGIWHPASGIWHLASGIWHPASGIRHLASGIWHPRPPDWPLAGASATIAAMRLLDMQMVGTELALKWDDGGETFIPLETLRRACPCAGCKGEVDALGNLHKGPEIPLTAASFRLVQLSPVGGYAIQPAWADGHNTGLFPFAYLKRLGEANPV